MAARSPKRLRCLLLQFQSTKLLSDGGTPVDERPGSGFLLRMSETNCLWFTGMSDNLISSPFGWQAASAMTATFSFAIRAS